MSSVSVIIPSRTMANLIPCVNAVTRNDDCDIIVVWDRSNGNDWIPPSDKYRVREVEQEFNYARNCNIGIESAGNNDVVLLNDDALLQSLGGFTQLQREAEEDHGYGIIGATTDVTGQPLQMPRGIGLREVPHFAFVAVFIPRRIINTVGLLDERYCLDYGVEDRDYCECVRRAGYACGVSDDCFVNHSSLTSTFRGHHAASRSYALNWKLYCEKWGVRA